MKRYISLLAVLLLTVGTEAQRIDINNSQNRTEEGYTPWTIGTTTMSSITIDGVTIKAAIDGTQTGRTLKGEWWKDGANKYSKLVADGVGVYGLDAQNNTPQIQQGEVGLALTISGLSAGEHTLLAYHNNPSGYQGPAIDVYVNSVKVLTGVAQTNRAQTPTTSGQSYIKFVATEGQDVVIAYRTTPDASFDYTQGYNTTSLFINALVFDHPNPLTTAADPTPEHLDEHADCDGNQVTLTWTPAATAKKHHIYIGTQKDQLTLAGTTTDAQLVQTGINPMNTYYWRVDEEDASGAVYEGDTWTFRPRRLAFPDAEGYGRFAIGGRGGAVYHVTSLDDDVNNPQPGTFRYGITKVSGPRTIVFDVAGVIYLKGRLTCSDKYVTVAGQTAPGRGILFRGAPFGMASDGITRFIRLHRGHILDDDDAGRGLDGLGMAGNDHSIMDHCSIAWTIDEGFSSRGAKNITLQRTLISEALNIAGHPNYPEGTAHGYAATIGGGENGGLGSSFHHNLLAHNEGRNWSMSGGLDGAGNYDGHHDMFNNVCYNWGNRATDGGTHEGQFVNNYYKMGPATTKRIIMEATLEGPHPGTQSYYVKGNIREDLYGTKASDKENDTYQKVVKAQHTQQWDVFVDKPFFESYATIETADEALQSVLSNVGCNQPALSNHDERMISETLNGTTSTVGSKSKKKGLIDHEDESEGFSGLNITEASRPAGWDSDQDGMPDWWEALAGTDKNTADNNGDQDGNGYTNLEDYLEWLAQPHFVIKANEAYTIDLRPYFAGFKTFTVVDNADAERPTNGFVWNFEGTTLTVTDMFGDRLSTIYVTVSDPDTGYQMTRQFGFAASDEAVAMGITHHSSLITPRSSLDVYDLQGRQLAQPQRGINIQQGKKFIGK
ncbi:MAG: hypothetical protein IJ544_07340 [Prevotella sp.]|nr:hypothetical protein [Prevotella sp.]